MLSKLQISPWQLKMNDYRGIAVPAREVLGLTYLNDRLQAFGWHAWCEVVVNGHWVPVDPTWLEFEIDATHINMGSGLSWSWLESVAQLSFKLVAVIGTLFIAIFMFSLSNISYAEKYLPDEPEVGRDETISNQMIDSYTQALGIWKTAEDINQWVGASFTYDRARAVKLSSNRKDGDNQISVYKPFEFFETKTGVCVDLARFGVETLKKIDPNSDPKYLMIEFEPIQINGNTFRLHWLVSFKKDGKKYFFCDSKRPGFLAGPFNSTQAFIDEYEQYRGRRIISHREMKSYQKKKKLKSVKTRRAKSPGKIDAVERE